MQTENQEEKLDKTKLETKKQVKFLGSRGGEKDDPAYVSKIKMRRVETLLAFPW